MILNEADSDRLFKLLVEGDKTFRRKVSALLVRGALRPYRGGIAGKIYLNIGHTGLDAPGLPDWLKRHRLRPVFLIHDLIPITHPEFCREGEAPRHAARMINVLESAVGIIANSSATLEALTQFGNRRGLPVPASLVAWLGTEQHETPAASKLPGKPYFVTIGTIEARKNHLLLLHLWERMTVTMHERAPTLVLIGQRGWEADDVFSLLDRSHQLRTGVIELGRCDDPTMLAYLDGARALLMPSFIEGFGIPLIEALSRGVPVIASDLPVFREIAGDIPLYLDPLDAVAWDKAIRDFTGGSAERNRQLGAMPDFHPPTWNDHFKRVDAWLEAI